MDLIELGRVGAEELKPFASHGNSFVARRIIFDQLLDDLSVPTGDVWMGCPVTTIDPAFVPETREYHLRRGLIGYLNSCPVVISKDRSFARDTVIVYDNTDTPIATLRDRGISDKAIV